VASADNPAGPLFPQPGIGIGINVGETGSNAIKNFYDLFGPKKKPFKKAILKKFKGQSRKNRYNYP